ncbi:hypothetical protein HOLleu_26006 [Holothuria leucospilota]|uniref:Uncharacterized protein n=1 Tax=Holothuria leucospilota TaxID=206669 RepID=A0A9Q1H4E2_HOLLE|nr:hypothetical protein HOLleu_26006 [Holothuria leucospilota]
MWALILPEEKLLGYQFQSKFEKKTGTQLHIQKAKTFQYIPLAKSLKKFLEIPGVMQVVLGSKQSEDNILSSYYDGDYYKEKFTNERENPVIPLLLYKDDFKTANPLGSKRGKHKVSSFYISVLSLPLKYQARLDNILLVALAKSCLVTKYSTS